MSKPAQVIILCEDKLHKVVGERFFKLRYGLTNHQIRSLVAPSGKGAAEQWVRKNYPNELKANRVRGRGTALIVIIDADKNTVAKRQSDLDNACNAADIPCRTPNDRVVHVIPKRAINTWLAWLDGIEVIENAPPGNASDDYKKQGYKFDKCESNAGPLVKILVEKCKQGVQDDMPASLKTACKELARIK
jgi:hypothetical protein